MDMEEDMGEDTTTHAAVASCNQSESLPQSHCELGSSDNLITQTCALYETHRTETWSESSCGCRSHGHQAQGGARGITFLFTHQRDRRHVRVSSCIVFTNP